MTTRRLRVEWVDTDASGRIHHTAAFRFAEVVEHELMRELGVAELTSFPRRALDVEFSAPLRFGDVFDLTMEIERVGRTSVGYAWSAVTVGPGGPAQTCFTGHTTAVHVGPDERPILLPAALRDAMSSEEHA
jgi:YbgC/YbaW family acyl-CoA thioester hydrolase